MEGKMNLVLREFNGICIRRWKTTDAFGYAELVSDPHVMKYIGSGKTRDATTAAREIENFQNEIAMQGWSRFAVSMGVEGPLIGYTGFSRKDYGIDFGMRFLRPYWGDPSTYISSCLALEYAFTEIGLPSVCAITNVNHIRCLSYLKKLFSTDPVECEMDSILYKVFSITQEHYLTTEWQKNRTSMNKQFSAKSNGAEDKPASQSHTIPRNMQEPAKITPNQAAAY